MHELGIMTGVMEAVETSARQAGATSVTRVTLSVGEMTEAIAVSYTHLTLPTKLEV